MHQKRKRSRRTKKTAFRKWLWTSLKEQAHFLSLEKNKEIIKKELDKGIIKWLKQKLYRSKEIGQN